MSIAYKTLLFFHIGVGFVSLVLFWVPMMARKGSAFHKKSGHWYAKAMYAVGFSALVLAAGLMIDPIGFKYSDVRWGPEEIAKATAELEDIGLFLMAISILVLVSIRHGLQTIRAKGNHALMRRADHLIINIILLLAGLYLCIAASEGSPMSVLFYIFAALCVFSGINNLRFSLKTTVTRPQQIIAHVVGIIGAGIGSHTAFFVFGASRVFAELLSGYAAVVPWVLPTVIGNMIIWQQTRRYRPRKA